MPPLQSATRPVPFVDLTRHHEAMADDLREAFDRVLSRSSYILGEEVEAFEQEFADYCGTKHCVGVGSGTAALWIALMAAGIGPGDEVIVPSHTFIASGLAVLHVGATPVFCDVEAATGLVDVDSAETVVTDRTRAIIAVHLYGQMCDMNRVVAFARRHGLRLIEDAAQAHGAEWHGERAGSFGDLGCFSFYPSKNLGALGDGGAITTDDDELAERARQIRHLGQRAKGEHLLLGYNERLDGLQAALLRVKLAHLEAGNEARRWSADRLTSALAERVPVLPRRWGTSCVYHLFPIRVQDRDRVAALLGAEGVQTGVHYYPALHEQPPFRGRHVAATSLERSAAWAAQELSLPMFAELTIDEVDHVIAACLQVLPQ